MANHDSVLRDNWKYMKKITEETKNKRQSNSNTFR